MGTFISWRGSAPNQNTVLKYLNDLATKKEIKRFEIDSGYTYYVDSQESKSERSIEIYVTESRELILNEKERVGTLYMAFIPAEDLVKLASITSVFPSLEHEAVNGLHAQIDMLFPLANSMQILFQRTPIIQCLKDVIHVSFDAKDPRKAIIDFYDYTPFFTLSGWDRVEAIRKANVLSILHDGNGIRTPVIVSLVISEGTEQSKKFIHDQFMLLNDDSSEKQMKKFNEIMIEKIDQKIASLVIGKDKGLSEQKQKLEKEEQDLKSQIKDLKCELNAVQSKRKNLESSALSRFT
jgi:hypothetical protein